MCLQVRLLSLIWPNITSFTTGMRRPCLFSFHFVSCIINSPLPGHVQWICNSLISDSTSRCPNTFLLTGLCVGDLLCRDVREEGASPSHLLCISPLIQQQPLNLIFQHFSPWALCSVFSCGMCWRTQLIVKSFYVSSCFLSLLCFFLNMYLFIYLFFRNSSNNAERFRFVQRSHKAGVFSQTNSTSKSLPSIYYVSGW